MSKIEGKFLFLIQFTKDQKRHNNRTRIGDWEADTVAGKTGKACLVTLTDRYSRFLKIKKVAVKKGKLVIEAMVKCRTLDEVYNS